MVVITDDRREIILGAVRRMYTELALHPDREFHFPTGRTACEFEGYDPALLDQVPAEALASFAGVNCPFRAGVIERGQVVLDVGSGSGTDALIASLLVGPEGEVIGLDMTAAMRERLERNARTLGASNVRALAGTAEEIPLPDASVDVVTTNGVLNLVPDKARAVAEIARVLRPGGAVQVSDIVLAEEPSEACRAQRARSARCGSRNALGARAVSSRMRACPPAMASSAAPRSTSDVTAGAAYADGTTGCSSRRVTFCRRTLSQPLSMDGRGMWRMPTAPRRRASLKGELAFGDVRPICRIPSDCGASTCASTMRPLTSTSRYGSTSAVTHPCPT